MRQDASVECDTEMHESITDIAVGFIVLWPVGSLVLYTLLLAACYKPLQAKSPTALTRATAFLHREYTTKLYWWDAVEQARRLVLTGFVLLIREKYAFLRLVVATIVCTTYPLILTVARPYKRVEDHVLAVTTSILLILLFLCAGWSTIFFGIQERYQGADPADVMGFGNLNHLVNAMIAVVFGLPILLLAYLTYTGSIEAKRQREQERVLEETNRALADAALEMEGEQCTFLFLDADVIRSGLCDEVGYKTTLPRLQEIEAAHPEWIKRRVLKRHLAYGRQHYRSEVLAVSHRWEQPEAPDASGAQLRAIREYLQSPAGLEVSFASGV